MLQKGNLATYINLTKQLEDLAFKLGTTPSKQLRDEFKNLMAEIDREFELLNK